MNGTSMEHMYRPALSLEIIGAVFLIIGALSSIFVLVDILSRRGWRTMMGIMIPVYTITGLYLGPIGLWFYLQYGRPAAPRGANSPPGAHSSPSLQEQKIHSPALLISELSARDTNIAAPHKSHCCHPSPSNTSDDPIPPVDSIDVEKADPTPHCHSHSKQTAYWVSVFAGVTHCGAGCVLGDIVGEWLVYALRPTLSGRTLWPALLIDYAFALVFGVGFQYLSIAPMCGHWGWRTVVRAVKADVVSLTSFEVGAFGWMIAYQAGIWGKYDLDMVSATYWWMMQVGMALGFATAFPVNWLLIKYKIKEPCV